MIDLRPSIKRQSSTRAVGAKAVRLGLLSVVLIGLAAALLWSAPSARADGGLPSAPEIHTSTPLHQGLRVYWWPPSSYGESAVTGYDVHYRASRATAWTDADHDSLDQPAVITGLAFNTTYEVRVRALNANGAGPWSSVERTRTSPNNGRPDAPWPPVITAGDGQLSLSWRAPAYTGARNRPIAGYRVLYTTDDGETWRSWAPGGNSLLTGTSTTITGLENGVLVGVVVAAVNSRGQSRYSGHTLEAEAVPAPALTLTLSPSLKLCTANTQTELRWKITGGISPYTLTIEGKQVDPSATSHRVNCGPLTIDPQTEEPLPNQTKTFSAVVTDARGMTERAEATVALAAVRQLSGQDTRKVLAAGTYRFPTVGSEPTLSLSIPDNPYRIFWRGTLISRPEIALCFSDFEETASICIIIENAKELGRLFTGVSSVKNPDITLAEVFDIMAASARADDGSR